jgi:phenylacetate-CoA ligase
MAVAEKIYESLPLWLQQIAISAYGFKWQKRRFGGVFQIELDSYKKREMYTTFDWERYQVQQLRNLLMHAFEQVPYYHNLFVSLQITKEQLQTFSLKDLTTLPFLEKNTLREQGTTNLLARKREPSGEFYASSGSTGTPTQILFSATMHQRWSAAFEARIRNWAGLSIKDARGMIGGRRIVAKANDAGPYYRYNSVEKQVYFSAYHISANTAPDYVKGMTRYPIQYMTGYAMSNYFLARFIEEQKLVAPTLKAVITSSEKLTPEMRATFKRVYGCKTYDSYSGLEACGLISECEQGNLHISPDVGIIELLNDKGEPIQAGETGEAVCTGLLNYDQPLIRYRIGDLITLSKNQQCACGRHMPIVDEIAGRVEDTVVGKDGRAMVRFHGIFINLPNIIEGQIIQHTIEDFDILIVAAKHLTEEDKTTIQNRMESQLGTINLTIKEVSSIKRNQNGKFKAVISHIT